LERNVQKAMPDPVRRQYGSAYPDDPLPAAEETPSLARPFMCAAEYDPAPAANDPAQEIRRPAASAPAPM
jgi:hypothetical protein